MRLAAALLLLLPSISFAYTPPADLLLERMARLWANATPVEVNLVLETDRGKQIGEASTVLPLRIEEGAETAEFSTEVDVFYHGGYVPFHLLTVEAEQLFGSLRADLLGENPAVRLDRIDSIICYYIEGARIRLWLRKSDLMPLKAGIRSRTGAWTESRYLEIADIGRRLPYPARTEVFGNTELVMVERLSLDTAEPDQP